MDARLEIQSDRFAIVVGPQFATKIVKELLGRTDEPATLPTFEFKSIVDRGVSYLLKKESFTDDAARAKFEARYSNAYELDPVFVLRKITSSLRTAGCYGEWLAELFECRLPPSASRGTSASLQSLLALQSRGALLVYVHCDEILARVSGQEPVLLEDVERWAAGERMGILQPHGVYSAPDSVQLDCQLYDSSGGGGHQLSAAMEKLRQNLCRRSIVLLGNDWATPASDPLLANFCRRFLSDKNEGDAVVLNTARDPTDLSPGLPLYAPSASSAVYPMGHSTCDLWKQVSTPCNGGHLQHQEVCLLVSSQTGAREVSHMMFNAPGVSFALVNSVTYGEGSVYSVLLRVTSSSLPELWHWLLTTSRTALLSSGLLGLALHSTVFLWLRDPSTHLAAGDSTAGAQSPENINNSLAATRRQSTGSSSTLSSNGATSLGSRSRRSGSSPGPKLSPSASPPTGGGGRESHISAHHHGKIIQRYKVVKKRSGQLHHAAMDSGYGALYVSKTCEDPGVMFSAAAPHKYARRGSLPPIKCGEAGNTLALFAERLTTSSLDGTTSQIPSYVAIKRALLSDKFKHVQSPISRLVAPKMLLNLLQAKKLSGSAGDDAEKSNLLAHRRNSDPGSYLQHRDKTRRRQLFLDENLQWIKTYGSVIERKIQVWQQKRLLRMQRDYFLHQQQQQREKAVGNLQNELHLMNTAKLVSGQLYASLAAGSSLTAAALPQAFLAAGGPTLNGFSSTQLMYQLPSTGLTPTPVLVPSPFVSPYAFMGGYATIPTTAHTAGPTAAYIMPPTALTAGPHQGMMLLSSGATSAPVSAFGSSPPLSTTNDVTSNTKPPFSSLLAPTSRSPPVVPESEMEAEKLSPHQPVANFAGSRKRKNSFPEKLSSLLQPPSSDPNSPPDTKRCCSEYLHNSLSPPPLTPSSHITTSHEYHTSHSSSSHTSPHHHHNHQYHRHHHHHTHTSSSAHYTGSASSSHNHNHHPRYYPPSSPLSRHSHPHKPASPLEQCLLQPPSSPGSDGGRVTDSTGDSTASSPSSDYSSQPSPQLWQFLLDLLLAANCSHLIQWTDCSNEDYEFTIHRPVEVAQLWGKCTNNSAMSYDKLARGLRYYYSKGIIEKVEGKKLTFRYNGFARSYVQQRCRQAVDVTTNVEEMVVVE